MILLSDLMQLVLGLLLAFLGGPFLRNVRGLCESTSPEARAHDRALGAALYGGSLFVGAVGYHHASTELELGAAGVVGAVGAWCGAVALGLRRGVGMRSVRVVAKLATAVLVVFIATSRGALALAEAFLLGGLLVWLFTTLFCGSRDRGGT